MLVDKGCSLQIIGSLMRKPSILSEKDKYSLTIDDFNSRFEKYIFAAISGLYTSGALKISPIDVENYLSSNAAAAEFFKKEKGIDFLQDAEELSSLENFPYYYKKTKKLNLLRDLKKDGFDISDFYVEDFGDPLYTKVNKDFEELEISEIIEKVKRKVMGLETSYIDGAQSQTIKASDGIQELIEGYVDDPDVGLPIQGAIINELIGGARKKVLTIRSGSSGAGKTRAGVGDACLLAYPIRFNPDSWKWELNGYCEKVLLVITEQSFEQVQRMLMAYITGFNESKFRYGNFSKLEKEVVSQAFKVLKEYEDNLIILKIPNPTIELVKSKFREHCLLYDIEYIFYDYIFIGPALLNEFKGFGVRNDEVLLMFATALKDLADELNVYISTSTQVNAKADDNTNIRNEAALAGGRATINKADNGMIMARVTKEEIDILAPVTEKLGKTPNIVTDFFKGRESEYSDIRIWSVFDLGTLRREDLFVTDSRLEEIDYETNYSFVYMLENIGEVQEMIKKLNDGVKK